MKCHGLGRVRRHTQRTTVIPAEITPSRELAQRGDLLSSGRSGKGETPRMRRGPSRRVKDILGGSSMCKGPARLEGHARGAVAGSRTGQGFISWAPGFLRYGPNHVCLFFQGDKFMTFDQSLKEFQRLRTAELAQPSRSERRKQVQRGPDTPPRLLSWPGNPDR